MRDLGTHPNIVRMFSSFEDSRHVYLLEERCQMDLFSWTRHLKRPATPTETSKIVAGIASALSHCHGNGVIHGDVKLENILMTPPPAGSALGDIKLTDFGWAIREEAADAGTGGTPEYSSPEVVRQKKGAYTPAIDMWALGVIIYELLYFRTPFRHANRAETKRCIGKVQWSFPPDSKDRPRCAGADDLISRLLVPDPETRLTADEVLSEPFVVMGVFVPVVISPPAKLTTTALAPDVEYVEFEEEDYTMDEDEDDYDDPMEQ